MIHRHLSILVAAIAITASSSAWGQLKEGDAAPKLQVGKWAQGEPVKEFAGDKVYIVEFWATWCGPCVASIPHLDEIHRKYKDKGLVVIGQNVMEQDDTAIPAFITKMAGKMSYRVATDDKSAGEGAMAKNWLEAAEQNGIPCAFVINKKGRIASIGHPMELKEETIEALLAEPSTVPPTAPATRPADTATAPSAKAGALARRATAEIQAGKLDAAEATIAEVHEALTDNFRHVGGLLELDLLIARKQEADALLLAGMLCEDNAADPAVCTAVAEHLIAGPAPSAALLTAAEKIAGPISGANGPAQAAAKATVELINKLRGGK